MHRVAADAKLDEMERRERTFGSSDQPPLACAGAGAGAGADAGASCVGGVGVVGRRTCCVDGAGLRVGAGGFEAASAAAFACGGPPGSGAMMLTAGIDADDGKNRLFGVVLAGGASTELGAGAAALAATGVDVAGHSAEWRVTRNSYLCTTRLSLTRSALCSNASKPH